MKKKLKFIDLFAGLGGFHVALEKLGCECVFASELKDDLKLLYQQNFPKTKNVQGDITKVDLTKIPKHDILCAGFPCQPFSQAGKRQGFRDEKNRGNMFDYICQIIEEQEKKDSKPSILLLENVSNLKGHDHGHTWETIQDRLDKLGYSVHGEILSPHQFGYPQHRKRIYIIGISKSLIQSRGFIDYPSVFASMFCESKCDICSVIDEKDTDIQTLGLKTIFQLKTWQSFLNELKRRKADIPRFPIWAMEFGATYDFINRAPYLMPLESFSGKKGKLGRVIDVETYDTCMKSLPKYAQTNTAEVFPHWKIRYIEQNRLFYENNKEWLNSWIERISDWDNSHQKFEWNCKGNDDYQIKNKIVQFRASGIRVKLPTFSPALNLVGTQVPILPWIKLPKSSIPNYSDAELKKYGLSREDISYGRYLSVTEAAKLQGMDELSFGHLSKTRIYEALGNAVNTQVVQKIAEIIIQYYG